ncbi:MAG: glycosyltransferase [Aurantimicrobium sp.]|nr:glycosyltransferase [Aurantimicrobium sp.]
MSPQSCADVHVVWKPGAGNYFFDIWQSARERYGSQHVLLHQVAPGDTDWAERLAADIEAQDPTHVIFYGEEDPNGEVNSWARVGATLARLWAGELIFLMYDSVYWWHIFSAEALAEVYPNVSVHATDQFPRELRKGLPRSGPGLLPTSLESIKFLESRVLFANRPDARQSLTFLGSLYPERIKQLAKFARLGTGVVVNPHRSAKLERPTYEEYAAAIGHSWATINLSRNHGMPRKHVKSRVLEAPLFGTLLVTDERKLTALTIPTDGFVYFRSARDLKSSIRRLRENPQKYEAIRDRGQRYARALAQSSFWGAIDGMTGRNPSERVKNDGP